MSHDHDHDHDHHHHYEPTFTPDPTPSHTPTPVAGSRESSAPEQSSEDYPRRSESGFDHYELSDREGARAPLLQQGIARDRDEAAEHDYRGGSATNLRSYNQFRDAIRSWWQSHFPRWAGAKGDGAHRGRADQHSKSPRR